MLAHYILYGLVLREQSGYAHVCYQIIGNTVHTVQSFACWKTTPTLSLIDLYKLLWISRCIMHTFGKLYYVVEICLKRSIETLSRHS